MSKLCPCNSEKPYDECCGPYISGDALPPTALALMRARYTAFTTADIDYIEKTRHPQSEHEFDRAATASWAKDSKWLGFELIGTEAGEASDEGGSVEFIARYTVEGKKQEHHEKALFQKLDGKWYFMDGDFVKGETYRRENPKVGRNDPCPCGSGKKFKKCCAR